MIFASFESYYCHALIRLENSVNCWHPSYLRSTLTRLKNRCSEKSVWEGKWENIPTWCKHFRSLKRRGKQTSKKTIGGKDGLTDEKKPKRTPRLLTDWQAKKHQNTRTNRETGKDKRTVLLVYSIEHYGIYTRPLSVKLIILREENLECLHKQSIALDSAEHRSRFGRASL